MISTTSLVVLNDPKLNKFFLYKSDGVTVTPIFGPFDTEQEAKRELQMKTAQEMKRIADKLNYGEEQRALDRILKLISKAAAEGKYTISHPVKSSTIKTLQNLGYRVITNDFGAPATISWK